MKRMTKCMFGLLSASSIAGLVIGVAVAQDPTVVDAKHYKVTFENASTATAPATGLRCAG